MGNTAENTGDGQTDRSRMHTNEYNIIKTDIELLKRDVSTNHSLYSKMDTAIEKMAEVANQISKMLIIHENKIDNHTTMLDTMRTTITERKVDTEKQIGLLESRITGVKSETEADAARRHSEVMSALKEHQNEVGDLEQRIASLENWKWYVLGIAAAVGFVVSQLPNGLSAIFAG